jgi:hypothetical protein
MNFVALDVAIGLILIYFLLSLAVLAINEGIATIVNFRAQTLKGGIITMIAGFQSAKRTRRSGDAAPSGTEVTKALYTHPLIDALHETRLIGPTGHKSPAYIPPRTFILALLDHIAESAQQHVNKNPETEPPLLDPTNDLFDLQRSIKLAAIPDSLKTQLSLIVRDAQGDMAKAKQALERWFDDAMERVTATYKSRIHTIGIFVGILVTFLVNADTIVMARALTVNPTLRAAMVAQAQESAKNPPPMARDSAGKLAVSYDSLLKLSLQGLDTARAFGLPLGYPKRDANTGFWKFYGGYIWSGLPGLLITALAVSLGAPFWFDLLNKVVNIRGAGRAPEEKPKSPEARPEARGA